MKKHTWLAILMAFSVNTAYAQETNSFLGQFKPSDKPTTLTSTVPDHGDDQNPYAVVVPTVTIGKIQKDHVLVDNFNNGKNLQGTGTTIIDYDPVTKQKSLFAQVQVPKNSDKLKCPGGVGLSTAMAVLKNGWVIVGSTPSTDGTTATKDVGCLMILNANGEVKGTISDQYINDPWGNMAVLDNGSTATLFISNTGFGVGAPAVDASKNTIVKQATVLRLELSIPEDQSQLPTVKSETVIAEGLPERADKDAFIIGPTGLALGKDQSTLYVSDALNNRIIAIENATTRMDSAKEADFKVIVKSDGDPNGDSLSQPLAMITVPNGNLLVTNGKNGKAVEIDPVSGKWVASYCLDCNKAQDPPGNGDLFGIALTPSGDGLYYVEDESNNLVLAHHKNND